MSRVLVFNPVVPAVLGGAAGALAGGINRGDDGPTGLQHREISESLRRTAYVAGGFALLGAFTPAGAVLTGIGGAILGASYQFSKNALD